MPPRTQPARCRLMSNIVQVASVVEPISKLRTMRETAFCAHFVRTFSHRCEWLKVNDCHTGVVLDTFHSAAESVRSTNHGSATTERELVRTCSADQAAGAGTSSAKRPSWGCSSPYSSTGPQADRSRRPRPTSRPRRIPGLRSCSIAGRMTTPRRLCQSSSGHICSKSLVTYA